MTAIAILQVVLAVLQVGLLVATIRIVRKRK